MFRSLGPENLLLKGATLKNTKKIYGELFFFFYHSSDEHLHLSLSLYLERENTYLQPVCQGSTVAFICQLLEKFLG